MREIYAWMMEELLPQLALGIEAPARQRGRTRLVRASIAAVAMVPAKYATGQAGMPEAASSG